MKSEHVLLLQAAATGALLAWGIGVLSATEGNDDIRALAQWFTLPGALAAAAATALALLGYRRALAGGRVLAAKAMAGRIVLHLLWILPLLVGVVVGSGALVGSDAAHAGVGGRGFTVVLALIMMGGAVLSAVVWALPAFLLAWWACSRFLARAGAAARVRGA